MADPFGDYGDYLARRWEELGGEAATQKVREKTGVYTEDQMQWDDHPELAEARAEEFKRVQCPIFVQIVGELYHLQQHHDVGLGEKKSGSHWETENGPIASDIIVLKSLNGDGSFQWVDAFSSMGGPESKPQWAVIEPNYDRKWLEPPVPDGSDTGDGGNGEQPPANNEDVAALVEEVKALRQELDALKAVALKRGDSVGLRADDGNGLLLCAEGGGPNEPGREFRITSRNAKNAWESYRLE